MNFLKANISAAGIRLCGHRTPSLCEQTLLCYFLINFIVMIKLTILVPAMIICSTEKSMSILLINKMKAAVLVITVM